jgi:DNA primase large subunit
MGRRRQARPTTLHFHSTPRLCQCKLCSCSLRHTDASAKVSAEEKAQFSEALRVASRLSVPDFSQENFFKVPWTRVPELVNSRRVFLAAGQAYVPLKEQFTLVLAEFQNRLSKALEITARALPRLDEDDRLVPVLEHLSMGFLAGVTSQYTSKPEEAGEQITAEMVEDLARRHFPACMRNLHDTLRAKKHLKHWGRLQYNLFLKVRRALICNLFADDIVYAQGIGMPIEEALIFWRKSFSSMTDDKFNKDHKYNIRHGYGLEGKRMNYPPKK